MPFTKTFNIQGLLNPNDFWGPLKTCKYPVHSRTKEGKSSNNRLYSQDWFLKSQRLQQLLDSHWLLPPSPTETAHSYKTGKTLHKGSDDRWVSKHQNKTPKATDKIINHQCHSLQLRSANLWCHTTQRHETQMYFTSVRKVIYPSSEFRKPTILHTWFNQSNIVLAGWNILFYSYPDNFSFIQWSWIECWNYDLSVSTFFPQLQLM